jgi:V/A-type H+-transporting ATPase subunit K
MALNLLAGAGIALAETPSIEQKIEVPPAARTMEQVYETVALASAVAFVTAVSVVGAGIAVGRVGSAALGAAAEKPELLTKSIMFVALAEGLAILGFAVAMMLMSKMT